MRFGFSKRSDDGEDGETGSKTDGDAPGDAGVSARRIDSTGTMRTEGNPVCCRTVESVSMCLA